MKTLKFKKKMCNGGKARMRMGGAMPGGMPKGMPTRMGTMKKKMVKKMQPGGVVDGPPHEAGGVDVVGPSGAPVAEVEGGERIFSVEDTQMLEQAAMQVIQAAQQDPGQADEMAKQLGYAVVQMIAKQEQVNPSGPPPGEPTGAGEVVPEGGGAPYMEQPV